MIQVHDAPCMGPFPWRTEERMRRDRASIRPMSQPIREDAPA